MSSELLDSIEENVLRIIRSERKAKSIKQGEIAKHLGTNKSYYSMMESGKRDMTLRKLVMVLDKLGFEIQIICKKR